MFRRSTALGCAMMLALTACGDDDSPGSGATPAASTEADTGGESTAEEPAGEPSTEPTATEPNAEPTAEEPSAEEPTEEPTEEEPSAEEPVGERAPATGDPIKVGFINLEGGAVSLPELRVGAETAAGFLNEHGGAGGRPIEIVPCNVDGTPEKSIDCANRLVGDGVSVIMEGYDPSSDAILPILDSTGIPLTGHASFGPLQRVAENAFFFGTANPSFTAGFLDHYAAQGMTSMMLLLPDNPAFRSSAETIAEPIAESLGLDLTVTFYNPAGPDWAALATNALVESPDVVATVAPDGDCVGLLGGLRSVGYSGEIFLGACSFFVVADPEGAVGVSTTSDLWKPSDLDAAPAAKRAELELYIDIMTDAGHADLIHGFAWNYFSDTWNLAAVLGSIDGEVTPESITDAFRSTIDLDSFMGPTISCDHSAWPGESACGNKVLLYRVADGGAQTAITSDFIDTSPYIAILGS